MDITNVEREAEDETALIRAVIATYQEASRTGSVELYRQAFHPSACVCYPSNEDGELVVQPIEEFAAEIAGLVSGGIVVEETARRMSVQVANAVASVQVEFSLRIGDESFEGTDFMSLARLGPSWMITHKLYSMTPIPA